MNKEEQLAILELIDIIDLYREEIDNNNKDTTAILDIVDLKSLSIVLDIVQKQKATLEATKQEIDEYIKVLQKDNLITIKQDGKYGPATAIGKCITHDTAITMLKSILNKMEEQI